MRHASEWGLETEGRGPLMRTAHERLQFNDRNDAHQDDYVVDVDHAHTKRGVALIDNNGAGIV